MKKIILSSLVAGTFLLGACGSTDSEDEGPDTSANLTVQNLLPIAEGQKFWYSEKANNYVFSIEIGDKSSNKDNSKTFYRATFADEDSSFVKFFVKTEAGFSISEDISEPLTLILPDSIPSDSGSFSEPLATEYTWKENHLTTTFDDNNLIFKFDQLTFASDSGIVQLVDFGDRKDYVFTLDSITGK
jgi:hypothetical protein